MHRVHSVFGGRGDQPIYKNTYVKVFAAYLIIALVMYWTVTLNITTRVVNGFGDVHQSLFNLWWVPYSMFVLHQSPYFTSLLYYPIGANLATQTLSPIAAILITPIYDLSPALGYNVLFFAGFALSGLFMFLLAKYLTKNNYASFIAGLIFAFSPAHIAQAIAHLDWTMVEFIPAFILLYLLALREKNLKYAALAALSFVLLTFMGDIEQGLMTFFAAIILTILLVITERKEMLKISTLKSLAVIIVLVLLFASPIIAMLLPYVNSGAFAAAQQNSFVTSNMEWSDNLLSFFLPSHYNGIFQGLASSYSYIYQLTYKGIQYNINVGERVSYLGYSVLFLAAVGVYFDYKNNRLRNLAIWLAIFIIFAWLAIGPYLQIGNTVTGIPGIYVLYRSVPLLNIIREPGRMDFIATIALAIMAAFGFAHLIQKKDRKTAYKYLAVFTLIILIEYNGMPLTNPYISNSTTSAAVPKAYNEIGAIPGNFSVLILPALSNPSSTPNQFTGTATYYASILKKPIIGGYTSRENATQSLAVTSVPLTLSALYLESGYGLVYPSPILENYSNVTLLWLANYNTRFISVIRPAYNTTEQEQLLSYLASVFGQPAYMSNTTAVFSTQQALSANAGRSLVSYTIGNWTPGYDFCSPYAPCNSTLSELWFGNNPRGIMLYSPADQNIVMSMSTFSFSSNTPLSVYLNNNPAAVLSLGPNSTTYSINMTVPSGFSQILLYSKQAAQTQYLDFGVKNITFTRK
ncbi:MAG: hypothetical protein M1569_00565 [Candidatus Marsarchaeota archaeon]|nr:hypothetical protein [Candidatus Marsarchaeota archaeon]